VQKTLAELKTISITSLGYINQHTVSRLNKIGLYTLGDCLLHLPLRYIDKTSLKTIQLSLVGEYSLIKVTVLNIKAYQGKKPSLLCYAADHTGQINLRFYNSTSWHKKNLQINTELLCWGELKNGKFSLEMSHPEYKIIQQNNLNAIMDKHLTSVYPTTKGLLQKQISAIIEYALNLLQEDEFQNINVPNFAINSSIKSILTILHKPTKTDLNAIINRSHPAIKYLIFEELLASIVGIKQLRHKIQNNKGYTMAISNKTTKKFKDIVGFTMTNAQQRVITEITQDINQNKPMMRLVQGDVGSGKTAVAAEVAFICIENNYQVAVMAPTELLAEQLYTKFTNWSTSFNCKTALLVSKITKKNKEKILQEISSGDIKLIVGTQAIFQQEVKFQSLGLIIIDEQHKFGVEQRMQLQYKGLLNGYLPHQLVMSATPIPRTLAMSIYADLDISIIDEIPQSRPPIKTTVMSFAKRFEVIEKIKQYCSEGNQVYWVCTLIEESEVLQCQAAQKTFEELQQALTNINIGLVHGKMSKSDKQQVMADFKANTIQLLVATTVLEVGIDVPNASLMIIENPERLGLSQLHQLRGRVGRGNKQSFCILIYKQPISIQTQKRLQIMRSTTDGFEIAKQDMLIRGGGEFLGTKQTGNINYKIADSTTDSKFIEHAAKISSNLITGYPEFVNHIINRWLGDNTEKYSKI
jgi:ATP-dependent DNA helicase RecG